jgi:hypothetical protein
LIDVFDYFVVPVVKEKKQQADTINTIHALSKLGIPKDKIRVVFNKAEVDDEIEDEFRAILGYANTEDTFVANPKAVIHSNEVFERLKVDGISLGDIAADATDYRAKLREAKDDAEKDHCVRMVALKRLGVTANKNLDAAFSAIFN